MADFDDLTGKAGTLSRHQANEYHKDNVLLMENFKKTIVDGKMDIRGHVNEAYQREVFQNREHIRPIVDTILTCSRQNTALRGHRGERGSISADEPIENDGNFRALLRYRIRGGDSVLQEHSGSVKANATYQSAAIQNELITTAANLARVKVVSRIKEARFWTIIADETMDRQKREQLAVVIRYASCCLTEYWHIYEDPISILDLISDIASNSQKCNQHDEIKLSGVAIAETLLRKIHELDLDLSCCVDQGYDGANTMASERVGVSATILKEVPFAFYFHCAMHCPNFSASEAFEVTPIRNLQAIIKDISTVLRASSKRTDFLRHCIEADEYRTCVKNASDYTV